MKLPTIKDIALEAGVNKCVVSHVLHDDAYAAKMRPETRQRILDIAAKLHYIPNQLASATSTGKVNTIAVILTFQEGNDTSMINQIMQGILMETSVRKFNIKVYTDADLENALQSIAENRIRHVITTSLEPEIREKTAELAEKFDLKLVYAYEHGHRGYPAINTDNEEMTERAVCHLAEKGHKRIGLLCFPHRHHFVSDRHAGYLRGMDQCGLKVDPRWIRCSLELERSLESMLSLPEKDRPTAFVTLDDFAAARVQRYAWKRGMRIPEDFSVTGIGDTVSSRAAAVPITTFREFFPEIGKLLVRLVLGDKLDISPDEYNVYHTHAELVERESVFNLNNPRRKK